MTPMMMRLFHAAARAPEGADGGGGDETRPARAQTFSAEYVRELREEAKTLRLRLREFEPLADEVKALKAAAAEADKAREAAVAEAIKAAKAEGNQRLLQAELRAAATAAGMVDLDGIKLLDVSAVKQGEDGSIQIPEDFFTKAREAKPYLFSPPKSGAETGSTTNPQQPPKPSTGPKHARDMTDAEFAAELAALGVGR